MQLLKRDGNVVMYKAAHSDYWEVHVVRIEKAGEVFGKQYPEREKLASAGEFGKWGWACASVEMADSRYRDALEGRAGDVGAESE